LRYNQNKSTVIIIIIIIIIVCLKETHVATVEAQLLEIDDPGLMDNTLCRCGELQKMSHTEDVPHC